MTPKYKGYKKEIMSKYKKYEKYKDSGVEWVNRIPNHWNFTKLKYLSHLIIDGTHFTPEYVNEGIPFLRVTDIKDEKINLDKVKKITIEEHRRLSKRCKPEKNDLLLSKNGTIGRTKVIDWDYEFSIFVSLCLIKFKKNYSSKFLDYVFQSNLFDQQIYENSTSVTVQNLHLEKIKEFETIYTDINEQKKIAEFLDNKTALLDKIISNRERQIEILAEERKAVINKAVTKGINPNVKIKPSGIEWLGNIPEHWEIIKIKYILTNDKGSIKTGPFGSQLKSSDIVSKGIKVYNQRTVIDNNFLLGEDYISFEKFNTLKEFEIYPNDLLITTRGTIGRCATFPKNGKRGVLHPCLIRLQLSPKYISNEYMTTIIQYSNFFSDAILYESNATTIEVIYSTTLKEIKIPLPNIFEQTQILDNINTKTNRIDTLIAKYKKQIDLLEEYKTSLISKAVTGQIDVRNWNKI